MPRERINALAAALSALLAVLAAAAAILVDTAQPHSSRPLPLVQASVNDLPLLTDKELADAREYGRASFSVAGTHYVCEGLPGCQPEDMEPIMQMPELPTGCEAVSLAMLLDWCGIGVSKTAVADAMPKSESDFVNAFLGDPYSSTGHSTMAPCVAKTANGIAKDHSSTVRAYDLTGAAVGDLPLPVMVWVTKDLAPAEDAYLEQDGYDLVANSHCVVLLQIDGDSVLVNDPLKGKVTYPLAEIELSYAALGKQAVAVKGLI